MLIVMKTIQNKPQERAVIGIIQDTILWRRVSDRVFEIINAFDPNGNQPEPEADKKHIGISNAFHVMEIHDNQDLCDQLNTLFYEFMQDESPADQLAQTIYIEWLVCIKNYCTTQKSVA